VPGTGWLQQSLRLSRLLACSHWLTFWPKNSILICVLAAQHHWLVSCGRIVTANCFAGSGLQQPAANNARARQHKRPKAFIFFLLSFNGTNKLC
jgi:hypothetical protein